MKKYNFEKFMELDPTEYDRYVNQLGQTVINYEHPTRGDEAAVIGCIDENVFDTDFFDTDDFFEGSDYNYILMPDGQIDCAFNFNL